MRDGHLAIIMATLTVVVLSCAPAGRGTARQGSDAAPAVPPPGTRSLTIVLSNEPPDLVDSAGVRNAISPALFGAGLLDIDERDEPFPVLAEAPPQLNTDSWRVFPDGRMETTYRLRHGLVWHDGQPLTAEDMVFALRVNQARMEWGLSVSTISPNEHRAIDAVLAPDPHTVVIQWRQVYAAAVTPEMRPLPRHILESTLDQGQAELLGSHPYWSKEYVGAGPFPSRPMGARRVHRGNRIRRIRFGSTAD